MSAELYSSFLLHSSSKMASQVLSPNTFDLTSFETMDVKNCSSWSLFVSLTGFYLTLFGISNVVYCYKFCNVWNTIVYQRRLDLMGFYERHRRRLTMREALQTQVTMDSMACSACCICLSDFQENEQVTCCDDGCGKWFHKECLFEWLEGSNACPCCRTDLISPKSSKGVVTWLMDSIVGSRRPTVARG